MNTCTVFTSIEPERALVDTALLSALVAPLRMRSVKASELQNHSNTFIHILPIGHLNELPVFCTSPHTHPYIPTLYITYIYAPFLHTCTHTHAVYLVSRGPEQIWTDPCDLNRRHSCTGFGARVQGESYRLPDTTGETTRPVIAI